jgi:hypothetical protein
MFLLQIVNIYNKWNFCSGCKLLTPQMYFFPLTISVTVSEIPC